MQIFPLPKKVLKHIESICQVFLWTGRETPSKKAHVSWDNVCDRRNAGGLAITSLVEWNMASVAKLLWNIHSKADKLWVKWVHMYFLKGKFVLEFQATLSCSWILKGILRCRALVHTTAWTDALSTGKYKTGCMYREVRGDKPIVAWRTVFFSNLARPRANFVMWLLFMGRLNTKDKLAIFGVPTDELYCFCGGIETSDHLFFSCPFTRQVSQKILCWMRNVHVPAAWEMESNWIVGECRKKGWRSDVLKIADAETVYSLWLARNEYIFQ